MLIFRSLIIKNEQKCCIFTEQTEINFARILQDTSQ